MIARKTAILVAAVGGFCFLAAIGIAIVGMLAWGTYRAEAEGRRRNKAREEWNKEIDQWREQNRREIKRLEEANRRDLEEQQRAKRANSAGMLPVRPGR